MFGVRFEVARERAEEYVRGRDERSLGRPLTGARSKKSPSRNYRVTLLYSRADELSQIEREVIVKRESFLCPLFEREHPQSSVVQSSVRKEVRLKIINCQALGTRTSVVAKSECSKNTPWEPRGVEVQDNLSVRVQTRSSFLEGAQRESSQHS